MSREIAIVRDPLFLEHANGYGHPESPDRLIAIDEMIRSFPYSRQIKDIPARDAIEEELAWIHSIEYIRRIEDTRNRPFTRLDPDTGATSRSYEAAVRAAGGAQEAVRSVLEGESSSAFAFLRPPGHHATTDRAMGFCLFNNIAIGAMYAHHRFGLKRVLIIDWDVHHGNGTMDTFYRTPGVLYFSIHEFPHYPGTGETDEVGSGEGEGYTVNVPLHGCLGDEDYELVFQSILKPIALEYQPELILLSAGFDAHRNDPLANMQLTGKGFGKLTSIVKTIAAVCCRERTVFMLEGGYDLEAIKEGIYYVLSALLEKGDVAGDTGTTFNRPDENSNIYPMMNNVIRIHKKYWSSLR